jgi:hypothetical protein
MGFRGSHMGYHLIKVYQNRHLGIPSAFVCPQSAEQRTDCVREGPTTSYTVTHPAPMMKQI